MPFVTKKQEEKIEVMSMGPASVQAALQRGTGHQDDDGFC